VSCGVYPEKFIKIQTFSLSNIQIEIMVRSKALGYTAIVATLINPLTPTVAIWVRYSYMHPAMPDLVKPSFVIFDIRAL